MADVTIDETVAVETVEGAKRMLRVIPIKPVSKQENRGDDAQRGESRALNQDLFKGEYATEGIIEPPFDLFVFSTMPEISSEMTPCIDAMAVNIDGLGHRIVPRDSLTEEIKQSEQVQSEIDVLNGFFDNAVLEGTLTKFRDAERRDLELTGNSYIEVVSNNNIEGYPPAGMNHLPSWTMRITKADEEMTQHDVPRAVRSKGLWTVEEFPYRKRFRRFVQRVQHGSKKVFFKEWGDPRFISSETGEVLGSKDNPNDPRAATPVIHLRLYSPRSPYGLPRFVGNLFNIYGNRAAEVINYVTMRNNNIPSMMLLATNVQLTSGSITRLREFVEERIQGENNYSTFIVVEAEPITEGLKDPGVMKLDLESLSQVQHDDAMFVNFMGRADDKVRRSFRLPPIYVGRSEDYTRACYSADTETLTEHGWKNHWEISSDEKIAAFNPMTGEMRFVVPEKKFVYSVENEWMYHIHGKTTDCLITGDHKVIVRPMGGREWKEFEIRDMYYQRFEVMTAAREWSGEEIESFQLPKSDECKVERCHDHEHPYNGDDWLEFLGYFISEGGFVNSDHPGAPYYVRLSQKDKKNAEKIVSCLNRLDMRFSTHTGKDGTTQFSISNRCLREWLALNVGTYSYDKCIPWEYLNLSRRQLQILMDALMLGDGTVDSREGRTNESYSTKSTELAGQIQRLLIQLGNRAVVGPGTRAMRVSFVPKQTAELRAEKIGRLPSNLTQVKYTGEVYCYSVPDFGYFVTRRNGRVAIQGNTADASKKLGEEQIFLPERMGFDGVLNTTVVPALGVANAIFRSNTPNVTDNFELTQLLATAERSGGLSPHISRLIVEDVLGKDLPPVDDSINPELPFTLTMLREQLRGEAALENGEVSKLLSDDEVIEQLRSLKAMMETADGIPEEAINKVSYLVNLMELAGPEPKRLAAKTHQEEVKTKTIREVDGEYCVFSEDGQTNFGCYETRGEAEERLAQIETFSEKGFEVRDIFIEKASEEEHIIGGAVLVPNRADLQGDIYDGATVRKAAYYFLEHYLEDEEHGIKLMHEGKTIPGAAKVVMSYVLDRDTEFDVELTAAVEDHPSQEKTTLTYPRDTWIMYARIVDGEMWKAAKKGELAGWSIGAYALVQELNRNRR